MVAVAALATLLAVPVWLGQRCVWSRTPAGAGGRDRRTAQKTETLRSHRGRNSELRGPASEGQGDGHAGAAGRQTLGLSTAEAQALRTRAPRGRRDCLRERKAASVFEPPDPVEGQQSEGPGTAAARAGRRRGMKLFIERTIKGTGLACPAPYSQAS